MTDSPRLSRRATLLGMGTLGAGLFPGAAPSRADSPQDDWRQTIRDKVATTPLVDTHEHLPDESVRLAGTGFPCDDWALLLTHYFDDDLRVAGMTPENVDRLSSKEVAPLDKWKILEPFWPLTKNTGYGQAVSATFSELYGIDEVSAKTVPEIDAAYRRTRRPGFYNTILREKCNILACVVDNAAAPYYETNMPKLLPQAIRVDSFLFPGKNDPFAKAAGIELKTLADWHTVVDGYLDKYCPLAASIKVASAYRRDIDFERVPDSDAEKPFARRLNGENVSSEERKRIEDHLFWHIIDKATQFNLPIQMHLGYYAGSNGMPLRRVRENAASAAELCRMGSETRFAFMHIAYPYQNELLAVAKQYTNAYLDMCWSWIIDPVGTKQFLKQCLTTAPANKPMVFGADYRPVENVVGHAVIARRGTAEALVELVEEGWISTDDAMFLADRVMHQNAKDVFRLPA